MSILVKTLRSVGRSVAAVQRQAAVAHPGTTSEANPGSSVEHDRTLPATNGYSFHQSAISGEMSGNDNFS